ncbi:kunitz trypsin inhibitor 5-like [Lotus japonicus]|uniref:kunitz trypsin inhibitor 5-like n=1 Tax=Lotus japonicus TaxID=34305 RepID=UPI002584E2EE|nr:kunitz trypsin inhibitor 5-like [Lotus japonicus]
MISQPKTIMKTITFPSIFTFLLFSLVLEAAHASSNEQVFDISGGKLQIGPTYYVLPSPTTRLSGLALIGDEPCPLYVAAEDAYEGFPVSFNAMSRKQAVVNISTDVNIQFYIKNMTCPLSSVWKIGEFDAWTKQRFVTIGGVLGKPGKKTVSIWFKIEKYDDDYYKIVYCPSVCKQCKVQCSDVGVYLDDYNENKRLALSNVPLKVQFKQA